MRLTLPCRTTLAAVRYPRLIIATNRVQDELSPKDRYALVGPEDLDATGHLGVPINVAAVEAEARSLG